MLTGLSLSKLQELAGHDGSAIYPPDMNGCGWAIEEFAHPLLYNYGIMIASYHSSYWRERVNMPEALRLACALWTYSPNDGMTLAEFLEKALTPDEHPSPLKILPYPAVICGLTKLGCLHAVAWDGERCYDPDTSVDSIDTLDIFDEILEVHYVMMPNKEPALAPNGTMRMLRGLI